MTAPFEPRRGDADALRLIADHPLAWLVSRAFHASPLPLIAETDASGAILSLLGIPEARQIHVFGKELDIVQGALGKHLANTLFHQLRSRKIMGHGIEHHHPLVRSCSRTRRRLSVPGGG